MTVRCVDKNAEKQIVARINAYALKWDVPTKRKVNRHEKEDFAAEH